MQHPFCATASVDWHTSWSTMQQSPGLFKRALKHVMALFKAWLTRKPQRAPAAVARQRARMHKQFLVHEKLCHRDL